MMVQLHFSHYRTRFNIDITGVQRATFLRLSLKLLDHCQLYFIAMLLELRAHKDILSFLPEHLSCKILSYLPLPDLANCSQVIVIITIVSIDLKSSTVIST